jgi:hypothetical protein
MNSEFRRTCNDPRHSTGGECPPCSQVSIKQEINSNWKQIGFVIGALAGIGMIISLVLFKYIFPAMKARRQVAITSPAPRATVIPPTPILSPSPAESLPSSSNARRMPSYSEGLAAAHSIGFTLRQSGLSMAEGSRTEGGREYRLVIIQEGADVDTLRLQTWGAMTDASRYQLYMWANTILAKLKMGEVPEQTRKALFNGQNIGDDGIFNGFCGVGVLQKPIGSSSSPSDRISLDLIFSTD